MSQRLSTTQLETLCNTAIQAAQEAGQWIEEFDRRNLQRTFKDAGSSQASQLVTEVDIRSEEIIRQRLQKISEPLDIAFVGEESCLSSSSNSNERFEKPYFWCVDPLDGTLPFAEGRSGYAVSVALVEQSGKPIIGVVYDPAHQVLYHAIAGQGSYRNLVPLNQSHNSRVKHQSTSLTVYADASFKTHTHYESTTNTLERCAKALGLDDVTFSYGSGAVINACQVIESTQSCYLKLPKKDDGGGSIWDYAATACIANEVGVWASNILGAPLELNRRDSTFMNHQGVLFASSKQIAGPLVKAINRANMTY